MIIDTLSIAVLVGNGVVAGVLFAIALAVMPALAAMPPAQYVRTHRLIGRHWDPTMPIIVLSSCVVDIVLAANVTDAIRVGLFAAGAVLLLGVAGVSHLANVPINKRVKDLDPDQIPADWADPRALWRNWNLLRAAFAVLALATNALAVVIA